MTKIYKYRKKMSWSKQVAIVTTIAVIFGIFLGIYFPTELIDKIEKSVISSENNLHKEYYDIKGRAIVIDGDTIKIGKRYIRFHGIDAPEIDQPCWNDRNIEYLCGKEAKYYLQYLINNSPVSCNVIDKDQYERDVAKCYNYENIDLNAQMVASGNALAYFNYSLDYALLHKKAQYDNIGIWQGHFMEPSRYRHRKR
ncbi:MAG: thermonuclease family protein [Emcibacter sp.]|nr:thermonuclease family protein [Emcibacter sp.]